MSYEFSKDSELSTQNSKLSLGMIGFDGSPLQYVQVEYVSCTR